MWMQVQSIQKLDKAHVKEEINGIWNGIVHAIFN